MHGVIDAWCDSIHVLRQGTALEQGTTSSFLRTAVLPCKYDSRAAADRDKATCSLSYHLHNVI